MTVVDVFRPLASHNAQDRGWEYVNRVYDLEGDALSVIASVHGTEVYEVAIASEGNTLRVRCSCPYFSDRGIICKHLWAAAVRAAEEGWLRSLPEGVRVVSDSAKADNLFIVEGRRGGRRTSAAAARQPEPPAEWRIALSHIASASRERSLPRAADARLLFVITTAARATLRELPLVIEKQERKRNGEWGKPQPSRLDVAAVPALSDEDDRWALSLIYGTSQFPRDSYGYGFGTQPLTVAYLKSAMADLLLPRLCATGRVRLRQTPAAAVPSRAWNAQPAGAPEEGRSDRAKRVEDLPIEWDAGEPWRLRLIVERVAADEGQGYAIDAVLERGDRRERIGEFALLTDSIAILRNVAAPFDPAGAFAWAAQLRTRGPFVVPATARRTLIESLVETGPDRVAVPEELQWEERTVAPQFHATIGPPGRYGYGCPLTVTVKYDDARAPIDGRRRVLGPDGRVMYRRDTAAEEDALASLKRLGVSGVDAAGGDGLVISARRVTALVHALVAEGWHVEAEGVRYRTIDAPRVRIKSGIDWFEVDAADDSGVTIALPDIIKAIKAGHRTITLGDGTIGMLPEQWLARFAPVLALGEETEEGLRFKPSQVALLDAMLAVQPAVDWDEGFARARAAIQNFEGVSAEDPPPTFQGTLREYQREALGWMRFLRDFGFGGCLADDMGLGKTVMVLAMLEARRLDTTRTHRPSLIVLPRSLLFNWISEASRFAPALRIVDFAHAERHSALASIPEADLVLTTYGTLRRDVTALQDVRFDYVVLDEAQAVKNAETATAKAVRLLRSDHRLALTGTPVENHLGELHSLFDFLNPGLLGRGDVLDVRKTANATDAEYVRRLAQGLRPFFLRRTKEQVAPELPPRTEETLFCELEGAQRKTYLELRDHYRLVLLKKIEQEGLAKSKFQILEALLRLRQAASHTGLLSTNGKPPQASAKFDLLLPRLAELVDEGRKALVFSQFTSLLALLREQLDAAGVTYEYLDGQTRDRAERVERFQTDPACPLFLISLKAGGVGLNLTAAEYVFLLDPWWNPAVEMQAIDRTHRIGQTKPVFAYRLVARDTVEERILELQSRKRALADAILEAGTGGLRGLQREDLEQLLS